MARPTPFPKPWPRGPVVTSIPMQIAVVRSVEKTRWYYHTVSMTSFRVTGSLGVNLTESLEIVQGEVIPEEV